jgi:hypothetical protein
MASSVCRPFDARSSGPQIEGGPHAQIVFYGMKQVLVKDPDGYELCFESPAEGLTNR